LIKSLRLVMQVAQKRATKSGVKIAVIHEGGKYLARDLHDSQMKNKLILEIVSP